MRYILAVTLLATLAYAEAGWQPSEYCPFPSNDQLRFRYEGDCSMYWECYQGARYSMSCGEGLEYSEDTHRCTTPALANCNKDAPVNYIIFPHADYDPNQKWEPDLLCPYPSEELYRTQYQGDCGKYWECYQGGRYSVMCSDGLEYSVEKKECDVPQVAKCNKNAIVDYPVFSHDYRPDTPDVPDTPDSPDNNGDSKSDPGDDWAPDVLCPHPNHELAFYPDPSDCSKYLECYEGKKIRMNCPPSLYWNDVSSTCDYLQNVKCDRSPVGPDTPDNPDDSNPGPDTPDDNPDSPDTPDDPTPVALCVNQPDGTYLANPSDCRGYYDCLRGQAVAGRCGPGLRWNQQILNCDYEANVKC